MATGLTAVPHALAARGMEIALQDDAVFVYQSYYGRTKALKRAQQLHATRIRANVSWTSALGRQSRYKHAPKRPLWNFGLWDALVDEANSKGIAVQLALTGPAPAFATSNHRIGPRGPKARYYRLFVKAAAQHFAGRVDRFSIWNEPNYVGWIAPLSKGPKLYRSL
jgi:beta-glucosidase/6-phospho-beta-glucosidase/beta-galactosidase